MRKPQNMLVCSMNRSRKAALGSHRGRKWGPVLCCILISLLTSASAATVLEGRVIPGETTSMRAPFGGTVKRMELRTGSTVHIGDEIAEIAATRVMATEDGVVTGIFAQPGDSAEQTVLYIQPTSKFTISASVTKAYSDPYTKYVTIGETVFIKCSQDGSHRAVGKITAVNGASYTVETTAGELYLEETVYIYRSPDYLSKECIGSGTVSRTNSIAVSGSGSIIRLRVSDGEEVERGQTLFETVSGDLDPLLPMESIIHATISGIVSELNVSSGQKVSKGDTLFSCYPLDSMQIEFELPQEFLSEVHPGDTLSVYFDWEEDKVPVLGTVTEISYIAEDNAEGETVYSGYISFETDKDVRVGMNVYVQIRED